MILNCLDRVKCDVVCGFWVVCVDSCIVVGNIVFCCDLIECVVVYLEKVLIIKVGVLVIYDFIGLLWIVIVYDEYIVIFMV